MGVIFAERSGVRGSDTANRPGSGLASRAMQAPLLWVLGFAMGIAAWVALGWLALTGLRSAVASASAAYRELRSRQTEVEADRAVAQLDAVRLDREERIARRAASRARRLAA